MRIPPFLLDQWLSDDGGAVLALRQPLAQLAEDRARHPVALQHADQAGAADASPAETSTVIPSEAPRLR